MKGVLHSFKISALVLAFFLVGCANGPKGGVHEVITLEMLMDNSSEKVSVNLTSPHNVHDVEQWLSGEMPTSATLHCFANSHHCEKVGAILSKAGVPHEYQTLYDSKATPHVDLFYDRIISLECISPNNNLSFGCALASNDLLMMTDRRQILTPLMSTGTDADHAVKSLHRVMGKK